MIVGRQEKTPHHSRPGKQSMEVGLYQKPPLASQKQKPPSPPWESPRTIGKVKQENGSEQSPPTHPAILVKISYLGQPQK